jgi:hypothetical protein
MTRARRTIRAENFDWRGFDLSWRRIGREISHAGRGEAAQRRIPHRAESRRDPLRYGAMAALKRMRTRNRGTIVQVSSALAHRSIPLQSFFARRLLPAVSELIRIRGF